MGINKKMVKEYQVRIEPYEKVEDNSRSFQVDDSWYLATIRRNTVGNTPKVLASAKNLATTIIEEGLFDAKKPFMVSVEDCN